MARTEVFIKDPNGEIQLWKTDLTGHGSVVVGEEFTAREMEQYGNHRLKKNGRRLEVRVVGVERVQQSYHVLAVEVLRDATPPIARQLF